MGSEEKRPGLQSTEETQERSGTVPGPKERDHPSGRRLPPRQRAGEPRREGDFKGEKRPMKGKRGEKREEFPFPGRVPERPFLPIKKRENKACALVFSDGSPLTQDAIAQEIEKIKQKARVEDLAEAQEKEKEPAMEKIATEEQSKKDGVRVEQAAGDSMEIEEDSGAVEDMQLADELAALSLGPEEGEKELAPCTAPGEEAPVEEAEEEPCEVVKGVPVGVNIEQANPGTVWGKLSGKQLNHIFTKKQEAPAKPTVRPATKKPSPQPMQEKAREDREKVKEAEKAAPAIRTKEQDREEMSQASAAFPQSAPQVVSAAEDKKKDIEREVDRREKDTGRAPVIYSRGDLLAYKEKAKAMKLATGIDRNVFAKSSGLGRKRREFKTLKFVSQVPSFKRGATSAQYTPIFASIEGYLADFNLALNQVSYSNLPTVAERILKIKVPTVKIMKELTTILFDKAMQEESFADVYAKLVELIQKRFRSAEEEAYDPEKEKLKETKVPSVFARQLAELCRKEFITERHWVDDDSSQKKQTMTSDELAARVLEISSNKEKEYARIAVKKRALSIVRFVAELFKYSFFGENLIHKTVLSMMQKETPENVERLCHLLKYAGVRLERQGSVSHINTYMEWLTKTAEKFSPRVRFMVEDLKELRSANWSMETLRCRRGDLEEDEDDLEWRSPRARSDRSKRKEKDRFKDKERDKLREKEKEKATPSLLSSSKQLSSGPLKALSVKELVESASHSAYSSMETISNEVLRSSLPVAEEVARLSPEYSRNLIFLAALVKIIVESYGPRVSRGFEFVREWIKVSPASASRIFDVFSYIEGAMEDIVDDSPDAPKYLAQLRELVSSSLSN